MKEKEEFARDVFFRADTERRRLQKRRRAVVGLCVPVLICACALGAASLQKPLRVPVAPAELAEATDMPATAAYGQPPRARTISEAYDAQLFATATVTAARLDGAAVNAETAQELCRALGELPWQSGDGTPGQNERELALDTGTETLRIYVSQDGFVRLCRQEICSAPLALEGDMRAIYEALTK